MGGNMALSPLDIQNKTFEQKMRGYNRDEVDDFLDQVVTDYENLNQKNHELEKSLKSANEKLAYFNELKDALNQSIIVAQETADKVKSNASTEAEMIIKNADQEANSQLETAKNQAEQLLSEAQKRAEEILNKAIIDNKTLNEETDELKRSARTFHSRLALMLESELQTVKSKEWDEMLSSISSKLPSANDLVKDIVEQGDKNNLPGNFESSEEIATENLDNISVKFEQTP
jgi:cell division initiation protein